MNRRSFLASIPAASLMPSATPEEPILYAGYELVSSGKVRIYFNGEPVPTPHYADAREGIVGICTPIPERPGDVLVEYHFGKVRIERIG